jgi:magnesium transporter
MLVNCAAYQEGRKLADIAVGEISDYLERPDCFVWVALHDATQDELAALQREFGLHALAVEDARNGHQRPKVEEYGDSLFVVMHLLEAGGADQHPHETKSHRKTRLSVGELDVFAGRNYVVSVRNRSEHGFVEVRERCEREPELLRNGAGFVLYALMDAVVDRYFPVMEALEVELETIEQQIFTDKGRPRESIKRLYSLKRRLMRSSMRSSRCSKAQASCTAAACRRCAPARRTTSEMWSTTWPGWATASTRSATPSAPRSTSTCRW